MSAARGCLITFEGPEGCGKSTHAARLAHRLRAAGLEVVTAREPGGTPAGEAIRAILQHDRAGGPISPMTEIFLFLASRAQLVRSVVEPALARGAWVVCDRFTDSTAAYQGYGRGVDVETIIRLNSIAVGRTTPDLTILLDLEVERGFRRLRRRNRERNTRRDRIEREALAFHRRVRAGYLALAKRWPRRFRVVGSGAAQRAVADAVWAAVEDALGGRLRNRERTGMPGPAGDSRKRIARRAERAT